MSTDRTESLTESAVVRRPYAEPKLQCYGDLGQLTLGQGAVAYDMELGSNMYG